MGSDDGGYSPGAIYELWEPMIKGAVDSEARCHGLTPLSTPGYWYDPNTDTTIDDQGFTSSYSGGKQPGLELLGFNPRASEMHWSTVIPHLFDQWDVLPDPSYLDPEKTAAGSTAHQLAMDSDSKGYALNPADPTFGGAVRSLAEDAGGMGGVAMSAFHHHYAARLADVFKNQAIVAEVVAHAVNAEQIVWNGARKNLMATAHQAVTSFGRAYPGGHGGGGAPEWLGILGAIAGAATLVITGGASATVLAGISTAAGSLGTFADAGASDIPASKLDGDSPQAVYDNIRKALEDLKTNIRQGEEAIIHGCTTAKSTVHGSVATYDLGSPELLSDGSATDYEDTQQNVNSSGGTSTVIFVNTDKMRSMANDDIPGIQAGVQAARKTLVDTLGSVPWDRPSGFGVNPYSDYAALVGELDQLIYDTNWALGAVADRLVLVAHDFDQTDGAVADANRDLKNDVAKVSGGSGATV